MKNTLITIAFLDVFGLAYHPKFWVQWIWYGFAICWFLAAGWLFLVFSLPFKHAK